MINNKFLKGVIVLIPFLLSCSSGKQDRKSNSQNNDNDETYQTDSKYKYEYRTGSSGDYEYNYDVNGTDEDGNSISGNVNMNGKYGSGYIVNEDGDEIEIDAEWIGRGELEAVDENGDTYELEVD